MSDEFEDVYLSENSLSICKIIYFILLENFDGDILSSRFVNTEFNLAEGSLSEGFAWVSAKVPMM